MKKRAIWTTRWPGSGRPRASGGPARSVCWAMRPSCCRNWPAARERAGLRPDLVTDQTSAHDPDQRLPAGRLERGTLARGAEPIRGSTRRCSAPRRTACAVHVRAMLDLRSLGVPVFDYGNNIRQVAFDHGVADAFDFPGFVPALHTAALLRGQGAVSPGSRCPATRRTYVAPMPD